ncbi:MAG: LacI family DNA-binding transcriptional regulator [Candidatus Weimeria sp.]
MITIKEIASALGVSTTTVSNVIHGKTREVSPQTVQKVKDYLREVHYVPNINARNLAQNRSKIIGVVLMLYAYNDVNIFKDPFVSELIGALESSISDAGYFMMLYISDDADQVINYISTWNVDGIVLFAINDEAGLKVSRHYKKPIVFIDSYVENERKRRNAKAPFVNIAINDEEAVYEAVRYLVSRGHKKIAFLSRNMMGTDKLRYKGYLRAMEDEGLKAGDNDAIVARSNDYDESGAVYDGLVDQVSRYTAVFCCSDTSAVHLINALEKKGISVPGDVSVIGFDDNAAAALSRPALTTVRQDIGLKGKKAVESLLSMIDGTVPTTQNIVLYTQLIERDSVRDI